MNKNKLLVITTTYPRWSGDHEPGFVHDLCQRLDQYEVHVVAPHDAGAPDEEIIDGVRVHRFHYAPERLEKLAYRGGIAYNLKSAKLKYLLVQPFLLGMFFKALSVAYKHDIHLFHAHWMLPTGLIAATLRELVPGDNRLLMTSHGGDLHSLKGNFFKKLRCWISNEADQITVVSQALKEKALAEGWPEEKISIAPMGVDLRQQFHPEGNPQTRNQLIFAGRLVEKKGLQHLVEAFPAVLEAVPDAHLCVAGHGPLELPLKSRLEHLGISHAVTFIGQYKLEDLPDLYRNARLAVLPFDTAENGDQEGLGLTLIEAMGCGLPVVAGDVPAVHDIVKHEHSGLLVKSTEHTLLAEAVIRLLKDRELSTLLAQNGRAHVITNFDWKISATRYQELLGQMY